jgi:hypothetical protein
VQSSKAWHVEVKKPPPPFLLQENVGNFDFILMLSEFL